MINVTYKRHVGDDLDTVNAARVSFDKEAHELDLRDERLIGYLGEHNHISPFGHSFIRFKVDAPVFVARQLVKHEYLRFNEISRRYVDYEPDIYSPDFWRQRPQNKKQGSGPAFGDTGQQLLQRDYADMMSMVTKMYERFIELGVAPEQARMMLPQSMMTSWWWSGSLDAFAKMCRLRLGPDAQAETREVAIQIAEIVEPLFPVSWKALMKVKD